MGGEVETGTTPELDDAAEAPAEAKTNHTPAPDVVGPDGMEGDISLPSELESQENGEEELLLELDDDVLGFWREESAPMSPVDTGTVIADRFLVVEALDVQEEQILYHAKDLQLCWQCGYEENEADGSFCVRCGVLMDRRPEVRLLEVLTPESEALSDKIVLARLSEEDRHFLLVAEREHEPVPIPEAPPQPPSIRLTVGQRSDPGQVRELDEDSLLSLTLSPTYESRTGPVLGLFAVADGMGGHSQGEVASRLALQVVADRVLRTILLPELAGELVLEDDIPVRLRQAIIAANDAVFLDRQKRESDMGTTLTTAVIRDNRLFVAHVGDCRAYRWNAEGLEQLTTDHSVIARLIVEGQAEPEELYTHPHRSIVYRCIGDKPLVDVDTVMLPLAPDDRVILCCDGLWEMLRSEGIEDALMQESDPQMACDLLVRRANAAGGDDNISVIIVQLETVPELGE
jgi:serine/threonine protein phosphatase PrpC